MKPISKKVIEAGLVPKHTLMLMRRWGYLDLETCPDIIPTMQDDLKQGFLKFVEELEELIAAEEEDDYDIKETEFSLASIRDSKGR